jgi:hypothetical protein
MQEESRCADCAGTAGSNKNGVKAEASTPFVFQFAAGLFD